MTDDRDRSGSRWEPDPADPEATVPPVAEEESFPPPQDPQPAAVHGEGLAAAPAGRRRDRWRSIARRRPTTRRGRGLLAVLAALALLLVGGAAGFAIGDADGGSRDHSESAVHDGDHGGRGDRGDGDGDDDSTTTTSPTSPSASPTTASPTTSPAA
jgi:hypothetical protein